MQLGELRLVEQELRELGFPIIAVGSDSPETVNKMLEGMEEPLTFEVYAGHDMVASTAFGIVWQADQEFVDMYKGYGIDLEKAAGKVHHQLPVPSVFLIDGEGIIRWVHSEPNHRVRPEAQLLVDAAKEQAKEH